MIDMRRITKTQSKKQIKTTITTKLTNAGIKVHSGKKSPREGEYSGIIGNSKKILELKI